MSDFLTTARVNCSLALATALRHARRLRHDAGQTAAEYMGVLLVVSVIIAAVAQTKIGNDIRDRMGDMVSYIAKGSDGTTAEAGKQDPGNKKCTGKNC